MRKYKIKKITFILGILFIVVGFSVFIRDAFFRPTTLNSFIVSKLYSEPVNSYFNDQNFYNCVIDAYNIKNGTEHTYDYNLSDEELLTITSLNCSGSGKENSDKINDASGLEKLVNLTHLYVYKNQLVELDVSNNTKLQYLDVSYNQLTKIDISGAASLTTLHAYDNQLIELDVSDNTKLTTLWVHDNKLTELDVSKNAELTELKVLNTTSVQPNVNKLTELDVSNNTKLTVLAVGGNQLTELDVSKNTKLTKLSVWANQLTGLDVSRNTELIELHAYKNQITTLNVSSNRILTELNISHNQLTELDVSKNTALTSLIASNNKFEYEDVNYVNNSINISNKSDFITSSIKLPEGKTNVLKSINASEEYEGLTIDENNNIIANKPGEYNIELTYNHDISSFNNSYTINYNLNVVELTSTKYGIDNENSVIYVPRNEELSSENILSNLSVSHEDVSVVYEEEKIKVMYGEEVLKEFVIDTIKLTSNSEIVEITDDYIWTLSGMINETDIITSFGTININDENIEVKYNDVIIDTFDIVKFITTDYTMFENNIYIGSNELDLNNIMITNATLNVNENVLEVIYDEKVIKTFNILSIKFNDLKVFNKLITISGDMSYDDFISKIETNGVTYKIYDRKESEEAEDVLVTSGNITTGMRVAVYKDETLLAVYTITNDYLDMGDLEVDNENNYILNINVDTNVLDLLDKIDTNGSKNITDKDGNTLSDEQVLATGYKLKIELSDINYEYTLVIKGDTDGDGAVTAGDAYSIILHSIEKKLLNGEYLEAAYVDEDNYITAGDAII